MPHLGDLSSGWGIHVRRLSWAFCTPPLRPSIGGEQLMMIGWAYLMAAIMTVDSFLLGLLLLNLKWPERWKKHR